MTTGVDSSIPFQTLMDAIWMSSKENVPCDYEDLGSVDPCMHHSYEDCNYNKLRSMGPQSQWP